MTTSFARTHLAAHLHQVSLSFKNVHLDVVDAAAAAIAIKIVVANAATSLCEG